MLRFAVIFPAIAAISDLYASVMHFPDDVCQSCLFESRNSRFPGWENRSSDGRFGLAHLDCEASGTILWKLRPKEWADSLGAAVEEGLRDEFELVESSYDACRSGWSNSVFG